MSSWKDRASKVEDAAAPPAAEGWKARATPVAVPSAGVPGVPNVTPPAGPPGEQGYSGITPTDALNFSTSVGENIPILGPLAVAGGERFGAGLKYLTDKALGEDVTYDDALAAIQSQNEMRRAEKLAESPLAAGVAAPLMAAAMMPTPFAKVKGAAGIAKNTGISGAAKRIGTNVALTAADDLARGELSEIPWDAGLVGGIQTVIEAAPLAKKTALSRALKAAFGQQKKAYVDTAKAGAEKLEKTGAALLAADEAGPKVVQFGSTPEAIGPRATAKKEFFGNAIKDVGRAIDEVVPQSVSGPSIAAKIRAEIEKIAVNEETLAERNYLARLADDFEGKGDISFADAQKHKDAFKFKPTETPAAGATPQDVKNKVKRAIGETMEDTVAAVADAHGMPELADQYARAKEQYGIYKPAAKFAEDRAKGDMAVRIMSPSDYVAGGLVIGPSIASWLQGKDDNPLPEIAGGVAFGAAHNLVRRRGAAAAAVTAKLIGDLLESQPALFGKFQGKLKNAEKTGGSKALILTHEALLGSPEYGSLIQAISGSLGKEDGDMAVIDDPALLTGYRLSIANNKAMPSTAKAKALNELNQNGYYTMDLAPYRKEFERQMIPAAPQGMGRGAPSVQDVNKALQYATKPG